LSNLFYLTKAPDRDEYSITGLFELPDNRGEEMCVRRVIQVDPNAHVQYQVTRVLKSV
jgi:hypothetical protein